MKNRGILKQWLISYILILILPVFFSLLVYFNAYTSIERITTDYNNKVLYDVTDKVASELAALQRMHNSIMIDSILSGLISNTQLNTDTYYNLNCAKKQLKIMNNSSYTNLYVYFKSNGYTVSGTTFDTLYDFYKTHFDGKYSYDEFASALDNLKDMDMSILSDTDGSIVLLQNVIHNSVPVDGVYTYFFINRSLFDSALNTGDGSVMLVKADNGEVVYCNRDYNGLDLSDKKYIKYERRAGKLTLSYYADRSVHFAPVRSIFKIIIINIILILLVGSVLVFVLLQKNYMPIKKLIKSFSLTGGSGNEFALIENTFNNITSEKNKLIDVLNTNTDIIKSNLLYNMLMGKRIDKNAKNSFNYYNIFDGTGNFAVVKCSITDFGVLSEGDDFENYDDAVIVHSGNYSLFNIFCELAVQANLVSFSTEIDDFLVCMVSSAECPELTETVKSVLQKTKEYMNKYFNISFVAGISAVKTEDTEVNEAYLESHEALEYCDIKEKHIVAYDEMKNRQGGLSKSFTFENKLELEAVIKTGDFILAEKKLNYYFKKYIDGEGISVNSAKLYLYDITITLLKLYSECAADSDAEEMALKFNQMIHSSTVSDMLSELRKTVETLCSMFDGKKHNDLVGEIRGYIDRHFCDYDLNINKIGETFGFAPSYISKMFKDECGEDISTYILKHRIAKSKELLLSTDKTVEEIAEEVGIYNKVTFTRNFKKLTNTTPGAYRKENGVG